MTYNHSRIVNHFAMLLRTTTNHINLPQQKTFTYHSPLPFLNLHSRNYFLTTSRWRPPRSGFFPVGESLNIINSNSNSNSAKSANEKKNPFGRRKVSSAECELSVDHITITLAMCNVWLPQGPSYSMDVVVHIHTCQLLESWSRDTWDVIWFKLWLQSDHCEGEALAMSLAFLGGPGAYSPGKFWKLRLSNKHF